MLSPCADGGIIAQSLDGSTTATFDSNGLATGQLPIFPTQSWTGNGYQLGPVERVAFNPSALLGTFAAFAGGNASQNGTAIKQVLTNLPQGFEIQKPELGSGPLFGNISMVEFQTDKSPDYIFQKYLQTYAPVVRNPGDVRPLRNDVMYFTNSPNNPGYTDPDTINVTGPNQVLTITMRGWKLLVDVMQEPFSVATLRFDSVNHVISAVTLKGHPLAGWRYWRVYSVGPNDVVIETGAFDAPGPEDKKLVGYYVAQDWGTISKGWREYMEYIRRQPDLNSSPGFFHPVIDVGGKGPVPVQKLLNGFWDRKGFYTDYLLSNICQAQPGALSCP